MSLLEVAFAPKASDKKELGGRGSWDCRELEKQRPVPRQEHLGLLETRGRQMVCVRVGGWVGGWWSHQRSKVTRLCRVF